MTTELPEYYFRIRENGAAAYRIDTENRHRRIEMEQIAVLNLKKGEVKPQGGRELSAEERKIIDDWMVERKALLARREIDDILAWIQSHWPERIYTIWSERNAQASQSTKPGTKG